MYKSYSELLYIPHNIDRKSYMKHQRHNVSHKKMPWKQWLSGAGFIILIIASIILILANRFQSSNNSIVRSTITDSTAPIVKTIAAPASWLNNIGGKLSNWATAYEANKQLRLEKHQLLKWQIMSPPARSFMCSFSTY